MAYDQNGNWLPDQGGVGGGSGSQQGGNWWSTPYGSPLSSNVQQQGGLGSSSFFIPSGQQQGGASQPAVGGYSPYGQGIQNYLSGAGSMPGQIPSSQMPTGLPQMPTGTMDPQMMQYLMGQGNRIGTAAVNQSGIAQGIQNVMGLGNTMGIPTDMNAGMRQIGDLATGAQNATNQQSLKDTLSMAQGFRGSGAGLGSNTDQMLGQALGGAAGSARAAGMTQEAQYMREFPSRIAAMIKQLSPTA